LKSTTSSMVCSLLDKLCKSKATGLDKISAKLLRYCPGPTVGIPYRNFQLLWLSPQA
ncbi:Hypothetical predicted protein, partial [Paramuricea clavata]